MNEKKHSRVLREYSLEMVDARGERGGAEPIGVGAGGMSRKEASRSLGEHGDSRGERGGAGGGSGHSRTMEGDPRRAPRLERLLPARDAEAPLISRF